MAEGASSSRPENGPDSKPAPLVEFAGGRVRFHVDLTPGETTIVSWKKLLKEANLSETEGPGPSSSGPTIELHGPCVAEPPLPQPPAAASREKEADAKESQAAGGSNRLSNVIERIERMYAGSSDEEDLVLDNMPDDDEYDTEDSFIDDAELDDYFQVDNSAIKHDGFFINRGKLERIEPSVAMDQQPKKRRRKDLAQSGGSDDGRNPHKITKVEKKGRKTSSSIPRSSTSQIDEEATSNADILVQDSTEVIIKKFADIQVAVDPSRLQNESELQSTSTQRSNVKSSHVSKSHSAKQLVNVDGVDTPNQQKPDLNVALSRASLPTEKALTPRKEGSSSAKPKSINLEKAFRELEKIVAQSRPPSMEPQDAGNQGQSIKRRLPAEIKQKLAEVARIAGSTDGQIPKDVINRLMSILGHLMQITTLKRNLRAMANMGLSAKQEKDDQIQKMKQEVAEMVKSLSSRMKSKLEQHDENSGDFQDAGPEEREALKRKYSFNNVLENKICELYDLYVERLEEDSGPPIRKLYEELASLWPSGFMNTDGIKRAIIRAKERKGLCSSRKDQEKIKKKKVTSTTAKAQEASNNSGQPMNSHEKLLSRDRSSKMLRNPVPIAARAPVASSNSPNPENKKEKGKKLISSSTPNLPEPKLSSFLPKKKVKQKKPNTEVADAKPRFEKLAVSQGGETTQS